ncbi:Reverse transcriptase [Theobroma cacao]|nr:Reverse transcriptase [Theobroma cacao]
MDAEMHMIEKNNTWIIVDKPADQHDIYIEQPEEYVKKSNENEVCKLRNALYAWYERIDEHFKNRGFVRSVNEHTLYVKKSNESKYAKDMLKKFNMDSCKAVDLPFNIGNQLSKEDESGKTDGMLYRSMISFDSHL